MILFQPCLETWWLDLIQNACFTIKMLCNYLEAVKNWVGDIFLWSNAFELKIARAQQKIFKIRKTWILSVSFWWSIRIDPWYLFSKGSHLHHFCMCSMRSWICELKLLSAKYSLWHNAHMLIGWVLAQNYHARERLHPQYPRRQQNSKTRLNDYFSSSSLSVKHQIFINKQINS